MTENPKKQFVQRMTKNFLDVLILRLIQSEPMWGYRIIQKTKTLFGIKLRHGALYPLLNTLETEGYAQSEKVTIKGRVRKIYYITQKGTQLVEAYYDFLKEQLWKLDLKEDDDAEK